MVMVMVMVMVMAVVGLWVWERWLTLLYEPCAYLSAVDQLIKVVFEDAILY